MVNLSAPKFINILALSLSGFAILSCLLAVPFLWNQADELQDDILGEMVLFKVTIWLLCFSQFAILLTLMIAIYCASCGANYGSALVWQSKRRCFGSLEGHINQSS